MKMLLKVLIGYGIFLLIGTAGASDMNTIETTQMLKQILMSIIIISSGVMSLKAVSLKEAKKRRNRLLKKAW